MTLGIAVRRVKDYRCDVRRSEREGGICATSDEEGLEAWLDMMVGMSVRVRGGYGG